MDLIGLLYGLGIIQGLLLAAILLYIPSGHRVANVIMAALVLAIALDLGHAWLIRSGYYRHHPEHWILLPGLVFTWGPLLYLYAYSLTRTALHWRQAAHFVPALLLLGTLWLSYSKFSTEQQLLFLSYFWSPRNDPELSRQVLDFLPRAVQTWIDWHLQGHLFTLHLGLYCALVLRLISHHNKRLKQQFSSLEQINLRWLRTLSLLCIAFLVAYLLFNRILVMRAGYFDASALASSAPILMLVGLIYSIGIAAIFQPSLISGAVSQLQFTPEPLPAIIDAPVAPMESDSGPQSAKYIRSGLKQEDAIRYKEQLLEQMAQERYYLDCDLTLSELAGKLDMSPQLLSQVINEQFHQSFFSFVSDYRIELAREMMSAPQTRDMPIVELALEVGFKSKSSFYNAFRKATQMTPSQFRQSLSR
jgi:AraC-like DNA-binding protein